ncbi:tRNA adenosine(34) deaminase TadA [Rheinheimera baltica]|uniref:tRNA-specific adenosine deaminase n=1 Tax=Rheinheimera baltica TaxID=67576 RepID=A0ABT9I0J8_9GAMM|nr:tRNA adenosine(34) deaminase TadA [Rheinheimera baltica]MDP5136915.1 tRNA adenosine(34) deaminase TadA [Rheinheimera baltica]MDP5144579.1 tRNA adenosine(34) deaminase TadA [Rheinheimera baltica]MDP5149293.1 tRNA adenosine(34) deaminase TadA [Rheinheimera baltica]
MTDEHWMQHAITLAARAEQQGEVPVGAVLVKNDHILGEGWNQMISLNDPSAHAEMQAIRAAAVNVGNYRLVDCSLYVTLEPCCMCAGVMVHSRIKRLIFGTHDAKTGAAGSVLNVVQHHQFNHQLDIVSGVLAAQCAEQLSSFFKRRRAEQKALKRALRLE